jgi:hypothetical protein
VLRNQLVAEAETRSRNLQKAARNLGLRLLFLGVGSEREFDEAFTSIAKQKAGALFVDGSPYFLIRRDQLIALAALHSLCDLCVAGLCRRRRTDKLRNQYHQRGPAGRQLHWPYSQGREILGGIEKMTAHARVMAAGFFGEHFNYVCAIDQIDHGRDTFSVSASSIPYRAQPNDFDLVHTSLEHVEGVCCVRNRDSGGECRQMHDERIVRMKLDYIEEMIKDLFHLRFGKLDAFGDGATFNHELSSPVYATSDRVFCSTWPTCVTPSETGPLSHCDQRISAVLATD